MKLLRLNNKVKENLKTKFEEYLNSLKEGDDITFRFDMDKENLDKPTVLISTLAYKKIRTLVQKSEGEVGWRGTVIRDTDNPYKFTITDIFVYPQEVAPATVTVDELKLAEWENSLDDDTFNHLRFQGHSHVNMGTTPSGTDNETYKKFLSTITEEDDFFIFMIFNKKDEYYIELHDGKTNTIYYKKDITVITDAYPDMEGWYESVKDKISTPPRNNTPKYTPSENYGYNYKYYNPTTRDYEDEDLYEDCKEDCKKCKIYDECMKYYYKKATGGKK